MGLKRRSADGRRQQIVTTVTIGRVSMTRITGTTVKIKLIIVTSIRMATAVTIARRRATIGGGAGGGFISIDCTACGGGRGSG